MLPRLWDVSIGEATALWTEEVWQARGSDSPKVAQLVGDRSALTQAGWCGAHALNHRGTYC